MASGNVLQRFIQLIWDRGAAKKAESDAQRSVGVVDQSLGKLKGAAAKVGIALAAAFAAAKLVQFGRAAFNAAREAEVPWNRLSGTLRTVGIEFEDVEGQIRAAARAMQDTTTVGDEQFATILQELTIISGDYGESLRNVQVVADLAAGAQIDFSTAAQLVGKAMVGETGTLKRYGIVVREGEDAVAAIRKQFAGLAENETGTLSGKLTQLSNEWGDFKEALGGILMRLLSATRIIDALLFVLRAANRFLEGREARAARLAGAEMEIPAAKKRVDAEAAEKAAKALQEEIKLLTQGADLRLLQTKHAERLYAIMQEQRAIAADASRSLKDRVEATQKLLEVERAITSLHERSRLAQLEFGTSVPTPGLAGPSVPTGAAIARDTPIDLQRKATMAAIEANEALMASNLLLAEDVGNLLTPSFETFFDTLIQGFADGQSAAETFGQAFVGLGRFIVGQLIEGFAQMEQAKGVAALASGTWPPNPAAISAAVLHFAAAGLFRALGAVIGARGGRSGRGGGSASIPRGSADSRAPRTAEMRDTVMEVHFHGQLSAMDPELQRVLVNGLERGQNRIGKTRTVVHR